MLVVPNENNTAGKKDQVREMFDKISSQYDFLNHFLSLGIDILWRKKAIELLKKYQPKYILDVATGTADFALESLKLQPKKVVGIDISQGMLEIGKKKIKQKSVDDIIELQLGDSENLSFEENTFDAVIVSFGVRNFENLKEGLKNINRVLKKDGVVVILEFSNPTKFPIKQLYNFYFKTILPRIGKLISKNNKAYSYLPKSVEVFPDGDEFLKILDKTGFKHSICKPLTFGISSIYIGQK